MTEEDSSSRESINALGAVSTLLGHLLLKECDAELVAEFERRGLRPQMAALDLELPAAGDGEALEDLAAEYFQTFLNPSDGFPLVQSLVEEGYYDGAAWQGLRETAKAAGVDYDVGAASGAPMDHLGSELLLWAELAGRDIEAANEFRSRHLLWALAPLQDIPAEGFYGALAACVCQFISACGISP